MADGREKRKQEVTMSETRHEEGTPQAVHREPSPTARLIALLIGAVVFVVVVPGILYLAGGAVLQWFLREWLGPLKYALSVASIVLGLLIMAWSVATQVIRGRGTPIPTMPPQKLVTNGPYHFTRNPMQLGALIYYFGLGNYFGSFRLGIIMVAIALIIGSCYNKFYEEKELLRRYGTDYEEYRRKTPFLIPKL